MMHIPDKNPVGELHHLQSSESLTTHLLSFQGETGGATFPSEHLRFCAVEYQTGPNSHIKDWDTFRQRSMLGVREEQGLISKDISGGHSLTVLSLFCRFSDEQTKPSTWEHSFYPKLTLKQEALTFEHIIIKHEACIQTMCDSANCPRLQRFS